VSKALNPILEDRDQNVRGLGFRAAKVWGTKENVAALLLQVADGNIFVKDQRHQAILALGEIKDERAVWPLAVRLGDVWDGAVATQALKTMGSAAEKELIAHLGDADPKARDCAWKGLIQVGSKQSLPSLEKAARDEKDRNVLNTASTALGIIKARP
jgi:HEAT repeat protein